MSFSTDGNLPDPLFASTASICKSGLMPIDSPPEAPETNGKGTGGLKMPTAPLAAGVIVPGVIQRYFVRSLILRVGEVGIFLIAVVGAVSLGLGITDYFAEHRYVFAYLFAYACFRLSDLLVRHDPDSDSENESAAKTARAAAPEELHQRIAAQLPLLVMFAAAPFERTYMYGGSAPKWISALGLLFELLGMWLALGARMQLGFFGAGRGTALVRNGFYRYLRHPIYAGTFLVCLGWPLEYGSPISTILTLMVGIFVLHQRMKSEEALLLTRFGDEYETYMRETDAMIPSVW